MGNREKEFFAEIKRTHTETYFVPAALQDQITCDDKIMDYGYPDEPHVEYGYFSSLDVYRNGKVDAADYEILQRARVFLNFSEAEFLHYGTKFFAENCAATIDQDTSLTTTESAYDRFLRRRDQQQKTIITPQNPKIPAQLSVAEIKDQAFSFVNDLFEEDRNNQGDEESGDIDLQWCIFFSQVEKHPDRDAIYNKISQLNRDDFKGIGVYGTNDNNQEYYVPVFDNVMGAILGEYDISSIRIYDESDQSVTYDNDEKHTFDEVYEACDF